MVQTRAKASSQADQDLHEQLMNALKQDDLKQVIELLFRGAVLRDMALANASSGGSRKILAWVHKYWRDLEGSYALCDGACYNAGYTGSLDFMRQAYGAYLWNRDTALSGYHSGCQAAGRAVDAAVEAELSTYGNSSYGCGYSACSLALDGTNAAAPPKLVLTFEEMVYDGDHL
jgi:hypothetical protein